jgi:pimeloyl-ACP methyl ester carboxylesterase
MRGHGMSPAAPGICARQMGEDIQAVMDHIGGDKFVLAGFGMGAYAALAWRIFCRKSETNRVSGMVLVNGYSRLPDNWTFVLFQTIASTGLMHLLWRSKSVAKHIGRQWFGRVATPVTWPFSSSPNSPIHTLSPDTQLESRQGPP